MASLAQDTVSFRRLSEGTAKDFELMATEYRRLCSPEQLTERALGLLQSQSGALGGAQIDLLQHGLQTATRAYRDGADEEAMVVCLLHDVGELLTPTNHGEVAAALLRPYITPRNWWILQHHEVFQGYYYFHHVGGDKDKRDIYTENEHFQATVDFCSRWDEPSFDPTYESLGLDIFRPMVLRVFSRDAFTFWPDDPKSTAVLGKSS